MSKGQGGDSAVKRVRKVASEFITDAFAALKSERVLPLPWFAPHVRVGRDYSASDLPSTTRFEQAIVGFVPDRFAEPPPGEFRDFPHIYVYSFLEEVIRRNASRHRYALDGDTNGVDSQVVSECVDELLTTLSSPGFAFAACRVVSHLTTTTGQPLQFGDILVNPTPIEPHQHTAGLRTIIETAIPGGAEAASRDHLHYRPPDAVIQARTTVTGYTDPAIRKLTQTINMFLTAVRLLTGATIASDIQIQGNTSPIGRIRPYSFDFQSPSWDHTLTRRVARLEDTHSEPISQLTETLNKAAKSDDKYLISSMGMAISMFNRSHQLAPWFDRLVDLATALEGTLIGHGDPTYGVTKRLRKRTSALLECTNDSARDICNDVNILYNLRSQMVHGRDLTSETLQEELSSISTIPEATLLGTATEQAIDRLRDIVRRSLLARIGLTHGSAPLWTQEGSVDSVFADRRQSETWRATWQQHITDIGFPEAIQVATPADIFSGKSRKTGSV